MYIILYIIYIIIKLNIIYNQGYYGESWYICIFKYQFFTFFFYVKKIPIVIQITSTLTEIPTKGIKYKVKLTNLFSII